MPFVRVNEKEETNKILEGDPELKKAYEQAEREYEIIKRLVKTRNEIGLSQIEVAKRSGLTQQTISRIETLDNKPNFRNFIKYIDGIGLEINFEKKNTEIEYSNVL